jgi:SP family sugar:H+ symporter-like MFS transporter
MLRRVATIRDPTVFLLACKAFGRLSCGYTPFCGNLSYSPGCRAVGLSFLPESPRYYVTQGRQDEAARSLARARGQPVDSDYIREELAEIVANYEHEKALIPSETYWSSWLSCFSGDLRSPGSNVRRVILGTSLQMMQQWTGVNFVFYFGTTFFQSLGVTTNPFLLSIATNIVSVLSTPLSWYAIEKWGRRPLLIWGAGQCNLVGPLDVMLTGDQSA